MTCKLKYKTDGGILLNGFRFMQVRALDGPNSGFIFPGIGQAHRNAYAGSSYGGVVFGYSTNNIRIFVPRDETGTLIHIPDNWGDLGHNQTSNRCEITVKMWSFTPPESCESLTNDGPNINAHISR